MVKVKHSKKAIFEHFKSYNFKFLFIHGEGKTIPNKPFYGIQEDEISKFSSTMVKVKAFQISHFGAFKKLKYQHFL